MSDRRMITLILGLCRRKVLKNQVLALIFSKHPTHLGQGLSMLIADVQDKRAENPYGSIECMVCLPA